MLLLVMLIMLVITACSKDDVEKNDEDTEKENDSVKEEVTKHPFTGIETDEDISNRAVTVMVNNHPKARPHSGLSKADIVFELLSEGDITRFLALYHSEEPEIVGPVRSAREYYFELANGYDALYVYHGAAKFVNEMIRSRNIEHLDGALYDNDGHLFNRESFRRAPHNSYLLFNSVYSEAETKGYDINYTYDPLPFISEEDVIDGEVANHIQIDYAMNGTETVTYEYDETSETYTRNHNNEQTIELNSEEPIEMTNVFVVETHHEVIDSEGRRDIDIESGGDAYLFQKGHLQKVEWKNADGRIVPVKDGKIIGFAPGKTWINFIPTHPSIEQSVTYE